MAIQAQDILGKWNVTGLAVAGKTIDIRQVCTYAFEFGGAFLYIMPDNEIRVDITRPGRWTFDPSEGLLELTFVGDDGKPLPGEQHTCKVTDASASQLKFNYADVNGIVSEVDLNATS